MPLDAPPTVCQAEGCNDPTEFVCDAFVMTPPLRGFLSDEVCLCSEHASRFEEDRGMSVILYPDNLDLVSAARWRD